MKLHEAKVLMARVNAVIKFTGLAVDGVRRNSENLIHKIEELATSEKQIKYAVDQANKTFRYIELEVPRIYRTCLFKLAKAQSEALDWFETNQNQIKTLSQSNGFLPEEEEWKWMWQLESICQQETMRRLEEKGPIVIDLANADD